MVKFKTYTLYNGYSMGDFEAIRTILENNNIAYKYNVDNREGKFQGPGMGTVRGRTGSLGTNRNFIYRYEIKIARDDAEEAEYLLGEIKRNSR